MNVYYSEYGNDIRLITDYLNKNGYYPDDAKVVDNLWHKFCDECYCASWLIVTDYYLEHFIKYLEKLSGTSLVKKLED